MQTLQIKKVFYQSIISAILSFLTFGFGFIRVFYFSKRLTMEEFGVMSLLLTLSGFLIYIFTLGSFQFLFKRVNEGEEARRSALWTTIVLTLIISGFGTILSYIFSTQITNILNLSGFVEEFKLAVLATAFSSLMIVFLYYHYGLGRNNFQNILQFLRGSLWVIISILISVFFELNLVQIFIVFNVSIFVILLISIPWNEVNTLVKNPMRNTTFSSLFSYCIPLLPYFAGIWGIPMIVRTQLNIYDGAAMVGLFSVAYTLMEIVFMFISTITATLSPYFFAEEHNSTKPGLLYNIMLKYSIICVVLIVPIIYLTRIDLILLMTSTKYSVAGEYIPWLLAFPLLRVLIVVFEQIYLKEAKTLYLGIIYSLGMLLAFVLSVFLIPSYSALGAIYASLIAYFFIFLALYAKQHKRVDYKYLNLIPILCLLILLWSLVFILSFFSMHSFIKALPLFALAIVALFKLPIFTNQEKTKLLMLLKLRK